MLVWLKLTSKADRLPQQRPDEAGVLRQSGHRGATHLTSPLLRGETSAAAGALPGSARSASAREAAAARVMLRVGGPLCLYIYVQYITVL